MKMSFHKLFLKQRSSKLKIYHTKQLSAKKLRYFKTLPVYMYIFNDVLYKFEMISTVTNRDSGPLLPLKK